MTYKQMTKEIEKFDELIKFMYEVQKEKHDAGDREKAILCGDIVNALCGYKNYHIYIKQYDYVDMRPKREQFEG